MRIFKKEFSEELTNGMGVGECIITRIDNTQYGTFVVHQKDVNGNFPYIGIFGLLDKAIKCVGSIEQDSPAYEYYLQTHPKTIEGRDKSALEAMGLLGWELCAIDSNITDIEGNPMYVYKRLLPIQSKTIKR